jgi:hypothetical protein
MARNRKRKTRGGGELDGLADDRLPLHRPSRPNTGERIRMSPRGEGVE